jgi:2-polyprenyl-6-methoxyphenol hydroxylase-like FAD-dependent oxidoreductase
MFSKSVLISGAGIAGPTLAYWLAERGVRPTLVESAPRPRSGGYVIDFWGLGYDIAERMGLLPDLRCRGYQVNELRFVDSRGRCVGGFGAEVFRRITNGRYLSLPRGDLASAIYRAIESRCEAIFGDSVTAVEECGDGVNVTFEHARARRYDLVVGADGLHSAVRRVVFGGESRFEQYLGYMVAAFEVEGYRPRDEGIYVSYGLPGKQVARFATRDDRTVFLFVFAAENSATRIPHDVQTQKAFLRYTYDDAGWECAQILDALDRCQEIYFDRVSQIHLDRWSCGRVALVGDAAFCPSLLAGQGTALAMTAAYILAGELASQEGHPERAFECYERTLRSFIDDKQRAAQTFAASFAPKTRFGLFLRNQISKTLRVPWIADLVVGRSLLDRLTLPTYP